MAVTPLNCSVSPAHIGDLTYKEFWWRVGTFGHWVNAGQRLPPPESNVEYNVEQTRQYGNYSDCPR